MSKIDLISGKWSDLVFDGRNKVYGAYALRQGTGKRNFYSMVSVFLLALAIWAGLTIKNIAEEAARQAALNEAANQMTEIDMTQEEEVEEETPDETPIEIEAHQEVQQEVMATEAFQVPEIKEDNQVKNEIISTEAAQESDKAIGFSNEEGTEGATEVRHMDAIVTQQPVVVKEEPEKVFDIVEQMPSFPGGQSALMQYLSSNIKYPAIAAENGVSGRVVVAFVVEKDGSITDAKVVKSVDPSLDREALRVVNSMPKWIPGKQNGSAVRVKFNVPVSFRLQ